MILECEDTIQKLSNQITLVSSCNIFKMNDMTYLFCVAFSILNPPLSSCHDDPTYVIDALR